MTFIGDLDKIIWLPWQANMERVLSGRPSREPALCGHCRSTITDREVPLIWWTDDYRVAAFCEDCKRGLFEGNGLARRR